MEKHRCKLCQRSFANGRALGGHMRSHMMNLRVPPKTQPNYLFGPEAESASSSSSSDEENEEKGLGIYGLREKPKKSVRMVDPHFSFAVDAGSVVLQDGESETESPKNPTRRRSKRTRKSEITEHHQYCHRASELNKMKLGKLVSTDSSWVEPEPASSISDTTPEEDVALCLMMLSRDKWTEEENEFEVEAETEETKKYVGVDADRTDELDELEYKRTRVPGKYTCETCNRVFGSYQALGGHRASHKKMKPSSTREPPSTAEPRNAETKIHQCPVCYRVFSSGQALGGHRRSHAIGSTPATPTKLGENLIDLNLPAPIDDDDNISQLELSAVSDAEFVNPIKH